jgi:hypothetical protein
LPSECQLCPTEASAELTFGSAFRFSDPKQNPLLVEQALGIIRNITCVTRNEVLDALDDYGEDEILELLQKQFVGGNASTEAVVQVSSILPCTSILELIPFASKSLYCLNNIATAGEASQLAIASRTQILRYLLFYLVSLLTTFSVGGQGLTLSHVRVRIIPLEESELLLSGSSTIWSTVEVLSLLQHLQDNVGRTKSLRSSEYLGSKEN